MRAQAIAGGLSAPMLANMRQHLAQGKQVLVFLNRRGYAPTLLCHHCGWTARCEHCQANMTVYQYERAIVCHHCGAKQAKPHQCGSCHSETLVDVGVGTEKMSEVLAKHFPEVAQCRIDRDTMKSKRVWEQTLRAISAGEHQLLIGTQMIAKGHHWPNLSLVLIVDADAQLYSSDVMALERLGQTLSQVSGRAGRTGDGQVVLQTHWPHHPFFKAFMSGGYGQVAQWLLKERQAYTLPPFGYHAVIKMRHKDMAAVRGRLRALLTWLTQQNPHVRVQGPFAEAIGKRADQYHFWGWLSCDTRQPLHDALHHAYHWQKSQSPNMMTTLDIDPIALG